MSLKTLIIKENQIPLLNEHGWHPTYYSMDDEIELGEDPYARLDKKQQSGKKRNFPITRNNDGYWVSRSSSVSLYLFCKNKNGEWCLLTNQRGNNVPRGGKWNVICGFIDYGETLEHAAARECFEECGIKIRSTILKNCGTNSKYDTINTRFCGILKGTTDMYPPNMENCENNGNENQEVQNVAWIPLSELSNYNFVGGQIESAMNLADNILPQNEMINSNKQFKTFFDILNQLHLSKQINDRQYQIIMKTIKG